MGGLVRAWTAWTILAVTLGPPAAAAAPTATPTTAARALTFAAAAAFAALATFPALTSFVTAVAAMRAVPAVALTSFAVSAASPATPATATAATFAARVVIVATAATTNRRWLVRDGRRGPAAGRQPLHPGAEVGIDFHDSNARGVGRRRSGATRAAPEACAAHRHPAGLLLGVGRRRGG